MYDYDDEQNEYFADEAAYLDDLDAQAEAEYELWQLEHEAETYADDTDMPWERYYDPDEIPF